MALLLSACTSPDAAPAAGGAGDDADEVQSTDEQEEAGEAQTAREIALQGPKSTAAMLAWLPLLGLGLGLFMGVDPLGFLFGSTLGRIFLIAGFICEIAGIVVVRKMVRSAQSDGAIGRAS